MGIVSTIVNAGKRVIHALGSDLTQRKDIKVTSLVTPIGTAAGGLLSKTGRLFSKGAAAVKNEFFVPKTPSTIASTVKKALIGTGVAAGGLTLGNYAATGNLKVPNTRTLAALFGIRTSPIATVAGAFEGGANTLVSTYNKYSNAFSRSEVPQMSIPTIPSWQQNLPDMSFPGTNVSIQAPAASPISIALPSSSFSPSVQMGGNSEILPLLLLLAGGGALGAYAINKARKKKKYKKKKAHAK